MPEPTRSGSARLADIRRNALPLSNEAFLLNHVDHLTALLEQAQAEARSARLEAAEYERALGLNESGDDHA